MQIEIINPDQGAETEQFISAITTVFADENQAANSVNVIFVSRDDLRHLKQQYFKMDVYTDVMAFNLNELAEPVEGEIYLSYEQIVQNAAEYATRTHDELYRVLIHGCLHLCGYEDDTPEHKQQMTRLEDHYLKKLME